MDLDSVFAQVGAAKPMMGAQNDRLDQNGDYTLAIGKAMFKKGHKGTSFILEAVVSASDVAQFPDAHKVGAKVGRAIKLREDGYGAQEVQAIFRSLLDEKAVDGETIAACVEALPDGAMPIAGLSLKVKVRRKQNDDGTAGFPAMYPGAHVEPSPEQKAKFVERLTAARAQRKTNKLAAIKAALAQAEAEANGATPPPAPDAAPAKGDDDIPF